MWHIVTLYFIMSERSPGMAAEEQEEEEGSAIESSFTDLMTSIAVIFILLLCATLKDVKDEAEVEKKNVVEKVKQTLVEKSESARTEILQNLKVELVEFATKGVVPQVDPKDSLAVLIMVPEGLLEFKVNSAEIPPAGISFLSKFVPKFTDTIYSKEYKDNISSIVVEGHTDSSGDDALNLELSQRRSMAVVSKCIDLMARERSPAGVRAQKKEYFMRQLSASGRGKQDLVYIDGKEDRQQSRRVIFKIRLRSVDERLMKNSIPVL